VDALMARREKIGRDFLETVTPLDALHLEGQALCGIDLGVKFDLARAGVVERVDDRNQVLGSSVIGPSGRVCVPLDPALDGGYAVLRLRVRRGVTDDRPPMQVHVAERARVIGILRVDP
ncbi:MAG: hypothetical protein ABI193_09340, partial [Minicystis sp.]